MGTRADFWTRDNKGKMDWLGSIGWDGYPDGIEDRLLNAKDTKQFKKEVKKFLTDRMKDCTVCKGTKQDPTGKYSICFECPTKDSTFPEEGWPWPWETSRTTDYGYVFDNATNQIVIGGYGDKDYTIEEEWKYIKYQKRIEKYNEKADDEHKKEELDLEEWLKKYGKCDIIIKFPDMKIVKENIFKPNKSGIVVMGHK